MPGCVQSYTHFLQRDSLYNEEKPYSLRYTAPDGFPRANIKLDRHNILVEDCRARKHDLSIEKTGCFIWNFETRMSYDDFDDTNKIKSIYLTDVAEGLCGMLGASKVQIFEHTVCTSSRWKSGTSAEMIAETAFRSESATMSFLYQLENLTTTISQHPLHMLVCSLITQATAIC